MYFEKLWKAFAKLDEVEAIALGGSRAGKNYDEKSDYDLYIYCKSVPDEKIREDILSKSCGYMEIGNHYWELEDDCTLLDGIDIDILYRNIKDFAKDLENVVEKYVAYNGYTTCMWYNLIHSKILYDEKGRLGELQKRFNVPYPKQLRKNIVEKNLKLLTGNLPSYDKQIKKAVERNDLPSINHRTAAFMESYFDIIFAVNKLPHPGEKRMTSYALSNCKKLPKDFEENIQNLYISLFNDPENVNAKVKIIIKNLKEYLGR